MAMLQVLSSNAEASLTSETWGDSRKSRGGKLYLRVQVCEDKDMRGRKCGDKLLFISTTRRAIVKVRAGAVGDMI